jgi:hypothetical protein
MIENLVLFVTHHIFLTEEQIRDVVSGSEISCIGHCVPVWMDAGTSRTTEPAKEIFCQYRIFNTPDKRNHLEPLGRRGYSVWLPKAEGWAPPKEIDFNALGEMDGDSRVKFLSERDKWWFNNPKPMDSEDLERGYLRFEIKTRNLKIGKKSCSAQHVIEISSMNRLSDSFF